MSHLCDDPGARAAGSFYTLGMICLVVVGALLTLCGVWATYHWWSTGLPAIIIVAAIVSVILAFASTGKREGAR